MTVPPLTEWSRDELRLAARMARDMAMRADAAGLRRIASYWRGCLTELAGEHGRRQPTPEEPTPKPRPKIVYARGRP